MSCSCVIISQCVLNMPRSKLLFLMEFVFWSNCFGGTAAAAVVAVRSWEERGTTKLEGAFLEGLEAL